FKKYKKLKEEKQKEKEKAERQKQKEKEKAERQKQKEKEKAERQKQKEKEKAKKQQQKVKGKPEFFNQYYAGMRYFSIKGEISRIFSNGYNAYIGTTLNLRHYLWKSGSGFFPDLNVAVEGASFEKKPNLLKIYGISGGPVWIQTIGWNHLQFIFSETIWFSAVSAEIKTSFDNEKVTEMLFFWQAAGIEPGYYMLNHCNNTDDFIVLSLMSRGLNINPVLFAVESCRRTRKFKKASVHPEISGGLKFGNISILLTAGFYYIPDHQLPLSAVSAGFRLGFIF
ncbi:MAG: hypothetical protein OEZ34_08270, partial [Spirochaetia bacterium]|nr:hypothetical protein [Spirochaetia bacterium]